MRHIASDVARYVVCPCVCVLATPMSPTKTAEPIEMPLGQTRTGPGNHALDGGAYWRNLAHTMERSMRGQCGFVQNYFDHLF